MKSFHLVPILYMLDNADLTYVLMYFFFENGRKRLIAYLIFCVYEFKVQLKTHLLCKKQIRTYEQYNIVRRLDVYT